VRDAPTARPRYHVEVRSHLSVAGPLAVLLLLSGCGDGGSPPTSDASVAFFNCANEPRATPVMASLQRTSATGAFSATLVAAAPLPPAKGPNTWHVQIQDAGGAGVDILGKVTPFMPDHNHGTSVKAVVTPEGSGAYTVDPLNLFMAGYWEITLELAPTGGGKDSVLFPVCIPG
jgi:hypothetical protein